MSQGKTPLTSTILLIEADTSLRRLITLGLQHRGLHVIEADSLTTIPPCDGQRLDLLILDIDDGVFFSSLKQLQDHSHLSKLPTIVLAWECFTAAESSPSPTTVVQGQVLTTCLTKPFDARVLYATVDQCLSVAATQKANAEASAEALLLASCSQHAAPSIWPVVTAAGLLLAVIGMMFQVVLIVVGVLLVLVALLLWTLNTKTEPGAVAAS